MKKSGYARNYSRLHLPPFDADPSEPVFESVDGLGKRSNSNGVQPYPGQAIVPVRDEGTAYGRTVPLILVSWDHVFGFETGCLTSSWSFNF